MEEPPSDFYTKRWEFIINKVKDTNNLQTLIFLDGDQSAEEFKKLKWIDPEGGNIKVICIAGGKTVIPSYYMGVEKWCYWYSLNHNTREIADMATAMMTRELDLVLDKKIPFIIVSRDIAFASIVKLLENFGREAYYINHSSTNLSLFVLYNSLRFPVSSFSELARITRIIIKQRVNNIKNNISLEIPNKQWEKLLPELQELSSPWIRYETIFELDELIKIYSHKFKIENNICKNERNEENIINTDIHPIFIDIKKLIDEKGSVRTGILGQKFELTNKLKMELNGVKWVDILKRDEIVNFLNAKVVFDDITRTYFLVSNNFKPKDSETKIEINIEDMTSQQLRKKYQKCWKSTNKEFRRLYSYRNEGDFSSFLSGRRPEDPRACLVIKQWLHSLHPSGKTEIEIDE